MAGSEAIFLYFVLGFIPKVGRFAGSRHNEGSICSNLCNYGLSGLDNTKARVMGTANETGGSCEAGYQKVFLVNSRRGGFKR
jgi:hypothetical protein